MPTSSLSERLIKPKQFLPRQGKKGEGKSNSTRMKKEINTDVAKVYKKVSMASC